MKNNIKKLNLYEKFHSDTIVQRKLVSDKNFTYWIIFSVLKKYIKKSNKILDIGCGAGTISFFLANQSRRITGIDISEKAIESCKVSAVEMNLKNTAFYRMDFPVKVPKQKYDTVVCLEVLEHLEDDKKALAEIIKLLNKGGILILSTPSINAPLHKLGYTKSFDKRVGHLRRYTTDQLISMFQQVGFKVLETKKTEGILRNFLFLNPIAGKLIRFIRGPVVPLVNFLDGISLSLFGESDIFVVARKNK